MKKVLLTIALFLRRFYSVAFEFFVLLKIKREHTSAEIEQAKTAYLDFVTSVQTIDDYAKKIKSYRWTSDLLKGLIDWSPSRKNLWTFFLEKNHSRDCDDFATLAYYTLKDLGHPVSEYCVLVDEKINQAHMIVALDDLYLFCNGARYVITVNLKHTINHIYKSNIYCKYR